MRLIGIQKEPINGMFQDFRNNKERSGGDTIAAALIFMNLLAGASQEIAEL